MKFRVLSKKTWAPSEGVSTVYLKTDNWNDYAFTTMFGMSLHDEEGTLHDIGEIKIGFIGQTTEVETHQKIPNSFTSLSDEYFSLGQSLEFYRKMALLPKNLCENILTALRDIVLQPEIIEKIKDEEVFGASLLRGTSLSIVKGQFSRVLTGKAELTDFKFKFIRPESVELVGIDISFSVEEDSTPSTNIHAIIGRNGVGKTTLLNGMIKAITNQQDSSKFFDIARWSEKEIEKDYFSSLVSVSFSAFDPFTPPQEQPDPAKGTCYFYIGLKDPKNGTRHREIPELQDDCAKALIACFYKPEKTERWLNAIRKLGSDENFDSMKLDQLESIYKKLRDQYKYKNQSDSTSFKDKFLNEVQPILSNMSSGHAIVLLTITRLVATVEEKTLVLLDEPKSHLHPPLLSAFIRALADLLHDRNGVAIIATHSPVVLQEIPKSCVWKIYRTGRSLNFNRPTIETFGENVGLLTSEIFSLEVEQSGFHELLSNSVKDGGTYNEILLKYKSQLGFEGRSILMTLIAIRDGGRQNDAPK